MPASLGGRNNSDLLKFTSFFLRRFSFLPLLCLLIFRLWISKRKKKSLTRGFSETFGIQSFFAPTVLLLMKDNGQFSTISHTSSAIPFHVICSTYTCLGVFILSCVRCSFSFNNNSIPVLQSLGVIRNRNRGIFQRFSRQFQLLGF